MSRERELSYDERATWGECPVCKAQDREPCHAEVGIQLGMRLDGRRMQSGKGAHLGRLQAAPRKVKEVPA